MRLSQFLADLNRKAGLLLECNDILIDGAVNCNDTLMALLTKCLAGL